jgi:hypothetical protein
MAYRPLQTSAPKTFVPTSSRCFDFLDEILGMGILREIRISVPGCRKPEKERFSTLGFTRSEVP